MVCPYCGNEMKAGKVCGNAHGLPYWQEDGKKRGFFDAVKGKGVLADKSTHEANVLNGNYCPLCEKLILDVKIK